MIWKFDQDSNSGGGLGGMSRAMGYARGPRTPAEWPPMRPRRVADQGSGPFSRASRAGDPGGDPLGILGGSDAMFGDPGSWMG